MKVWLEFTKLLTNINSSFHKIFVLCNLDEGLRMVKDVFFFSIFFCFSTFFSLFSKCFFFFLLVSLLSFLVFPCYPIMFLVTPHPMLYGGYRVRLFAYPLCFWMSSSTMHSRAPIGPRLLLLPTATKAE